MSEKEEKCKGEDVDVEEGEISDSCSVEEISEKDFTKGDEPQKTINKDKEVAATASVNNLGDFNSTRVWTMQDLYKYHNNYQISTGYASGLYNIAWAQAVNNKPLNQFLITNNNFRNQTVDNSNVNSLSDDDDDDDNVSKNKNNNSAAADNGVSRNDSGKEGRKVVIQVEDDNGTEKGGMLEEGELEEGEIDLDSEAVDAVNDSHLVGAHFKSGDVNSDNELEKQLNLISKDLQTLSLNDGDK